MIDVLKFLPLAALIAGFAIYGNNPPEKSLGSWSQVGSSAYVEVINNSKRNLPIFVSAPEVDSVRRFLGIVEGCSLLRAKLPYADTRVFFHVDSMILPIDVNEPGVYTVEIGAFNPTQSCQYSTKLIGYVLDFVDPVRWKTSPFYRHEDLTTPAMVILAMDGTVCVLFESIVDVPRPQEKFTCPSQWRTRR